MRSLQGRFEHVTALIADGDSNQRHIVRGLLMHFGLRQILEASDGSSTLEALDRSHPDILIVDWHLPLLNGPEIVKLIRNPFASKHALLPILMMLSEARSSVVEQAMRLGVHEILVKPFSANTLWWRLESVVHHPRAFMHQADYFGPKRRASLSASRPSGITTPPVYEFY